MGEVRAFYDRVQCLGDIEAASRGLAALPAALPNNTHIHLPPNFSAFDSVAEAISAASAEGVQVLGVSNYYDYSVYAEFAQRATNAAIFPLFGTEIICLDERLARDGIRVNDPANPGKIYICGKGITHFEPMSDEAATLLQVIRDKDSLRMREMIDRLQQVFTAAGFDADLDEQQVKEMVVRRHACPLETVYLQERHVAQAFQERLAGCLREVEQRAVLRRAYGGDPSAPLDDPVAVQNEMRSRLMKAGKPGYVPETFVSLDHARRLILALGGIPCYPVLADGVVPYCEYEAEPENLVNRLLELGIRCAEFIPNRNEPEVLRHYATTLREAGIVVTAGTEHNTRDRIPVTPTCKRGIPLPEDVAAMFWEGACIVAAHQYQKMLSGSGFLERASDDSDIAALAKLGAVVIERYVALARS